MLLLQSWSGGQREGRPDPSSPQQPRARPSLTGASLRLLARWTPAVCLAERPCQTRALPLTTWAASPSGQIGLLVGERAEFSWPHMITASWLLPFLFKDSDPDSALPLSPHPRRKSCLLLRASQVTGNWGSQRVCHHTQGKVPGPHTCALRRQKPSLETGLCPRRASAHGESSRKWRGQRFPLTHAGNPRRAPGRKEHC